MILTLPAGRPAPTLPNLKEIKGSWVHVADGGPSKFKPGLNQDLTMSQRLNLGLKETIFGSMQIKKGLKMKRRLTHALK